MNSRLTRILVAAVLGLTLSGCLGVLGASDKIPSLVGDRRVLFIGNSHTYMNDLPKMVQTLARAAGDTALRTASIAEPNWSLEDHGLAGLAAQALTKSDWEFVVMQQGTSAAPESQVHLAYWSGVFAPTIRNAGAEPVMYQIWPLGYQRFNADAALTSYHNAAVAVDGLLAPAGDAFTAALDTNAAIGVYAADGLHATRRGTYLAALVILARVAEIDPQSLPLTIPGATESPAIVAQLQAAALALSRNPARPTVPR